MMHARGHEERPTRLICRAPSLCALQLAATLALGSSAHAQCAALDGASPVEPSIAAAYERGRAAFAQSEWQAAQAEFERVFEQLGCAQARRRAEVAYALGQCARYREDFASAFYYYLLAAKAFADERDPDAAAWREEAQSHARVVSERLMLISLELAPLQTGEASSGDAPPLVICDVVVDGTPLARVDPATARSSFDADQAGSTRDREALLQSLERGWLGGVHAPRPDTAQPTRSGSCRWQGVSPERIELVAKRGQHEIEIDRRMGEERRPARIVVAAESPPAVRVRLADTLAHVKLEPAQRGRGIRAIDVKAALRADAGGREYDLRWENVVDVAPGSYSAEVAVSDFEARLKMALGGKLVSADRLSVLPGEERVLQVEAKPRGTSLFESPWLWTGVGAAVAGAIISGVLISNSNRERAPVNGGSLDWVIKIPK